MDKEGLRLLNLVGIILFFIIGIALISAQYYQLNRYREIRHEIEDMRSGTPDSDNSRDSEYSFCIGLLIIWLFIILIFTFLLYYYTVKGLDRGDYEAAKRWTLIGIIVGFAGGILPLIIFIISYVSFDDAIRTQKYSPTYSGSYQQPGTIRYCDSCRRQIPFDSKLCPYCGMQQSTLDSYEKPHPPPPESGKTIPVEEQHHKPPPPPPPK